MFVIPVILGSVRIGRQSEKVARYLATRLRRTERIETEIIDLRELDLPIMEERLRMRDDRPPRIVDFSRRIERADAIVVVSPEYNNSYPGVLKNALDYLLPEYRRKPFGIATVSSGPFGGLNALAQLRLVVLSLGGYPIPGRFPVTKVAETFDEQGEPRDPAIEKTAERFIDDLLWLTEAVTARKALDRERVPPPPAPSTVPTIATTTPISPAAGATTEDKR